MNDPDDVNTIVRKIRETEVKRWTDPATGRTFTPIPLAEFMELTGLVEQEVAFYRDRRPHPALGRKIDFMKGKRPAGRTRLGMGYRYSREDGETTARHLQLRTLRLSEGKSMMESLRCELRAILPAWFVCTLIPLPAITFRRFLDGEPVAHFCFLACCMALVASRFRDKIISEQPWNSWHVKMLALSAALISSSIVFSLLWLGLADAHDYVTPFIALQALIPSLCIVPYVTLLTRKPAAAVILSAFLVGCMKMVAGIVVNLRYGWDYDHHELPWTEPNLMLWAFWVATAILSVLLLILGANKYRAQLGHVS